MRGTARNSTTGPTTGIGTGRVTVWLPTRPIACCSAKAGACPISTDANTAGYSTFRSTVVIDTEAQASHGRTAGMAAIDGKPPVIVLRILMLLITAGVIGAILATYLLVARAIPNYNFLKDGDENHKRHIGTLYRADPELGFAYIPGAQGIVMMPPGPDVAVRIDQRGFRVPASARNEPSAAQARRPVVLALGCSYTYGAAAKAEDTFAFLVGESLGGTTVNAGLAGGGLSQMLLLARKLVPAIKPDYLVVQYSPWLAERAQGPFAPFAFGRVPQPYFFGDAAPTLHGPVFQGMVMNIPWDRWASTPRSFSDFMSFLWNGVLPHAIYDGTNLALYHIKRMLGVLPAPTRESEAVDRAAYREIAEIGKANGAKLVMVIMGTQAQPVKPPMGVASEYLVVDANATLIDRLPSPDQRNWIEQYAIWRGDPPRAVDFHPNAKAHRIVAEEIVSKIQASTSAERGR